jgi:urease accessory protein
MLDITPSPDRAAPAREAAPRGLQRARGHVRLGFRLVEGRSAISTLYQAGSIKPRLPKVPAGQSPEAVLINTAGGIAGGDHFRTEVIVGAGATATVTSQACERIYRSCDEASRVETTVRLEAGARLEWLPQETILFDGGRLSRRLTVEMADDAQLLAMEAVVFGRTARGEVVRDGSWRDTWRIHRGGRLVFADSMLVTGSIADALSRAGVLGGGCAAASLVQVAPGAGERLDAVRGALETGPAEGGASARNGLLVARLAAADGAALRASLTRVLGVLRDGRALPRVWMC